MYAVEPNKYWNILPLLHMHAVMGCNQYFQGISSIEFNRHFRLACKRGVNAGRLMKDGVTVNTVYRLASNAFPVVQNHDVVVASPSETTPQLNKETEQAQLEVIKNKTY